MTLKSWSGWSWWSNTNHHQLRQHCAATTEACKTAGSASPRWCTPGIAVPATTTPAKPKYRMFATTFTSSEANLCYRRKKHWLENCAASSTGLLCCVCLEVLHKRSYTSGYRQHCFQTLIAKLHKTRADTAALPLVVEPLLQTAQGAHGDRLVLCSCCARGHHARSRGRGLTTIRWLLGCRY